MPGAPPRFASPDSYTPKHLAERIINSKAALEGERKHVTVLFADLKGSMELLGNRDPEEARKILDPVLGLMMDAVHRYEGTVNQVMGDGIMALFGAPVAHEDHAVRACFAALTMQQSVADYASHVPQVPLQIRVGLNSGEVVVRAIGSDLHMDYTAVGQTTNLGARMEQIAGPGSTLLTAETFTLVEGFVTARSLGPMAIKGLTSRVEVYELIGIGAVRSRFQAAARRGLSRFVGRIAEYEQLRRSLERARQRRGQIVAIVGEPGVGKSRLIFEFTHSHRSEGWLVLEAQPVSYGKATSYLPVIELLKNYFGIGQQDGHDDIRAKVFTKVQALDEALEVLLPELLALLGVPIDDPRWYALDPTQRRQRTLDAVKRLLLREAELQPLLLLFEDLHWIDAETQALLDILVGVLPTAGMLLLVNYRPEYEHGWSDKEFYSEIRLDPLSAESARELLDGLLGEDTTSAPLKRVLIERTEGNPFFLEESVRTLVEAKVLRGEPGDYRVVTPIRPTQIPGTVQAVLATLSDALTQLAHVHYLQGNLAEATRLLERSITLCRELQLSLAAGMARPLLGLVYSLRGRSDDGISMLELARADLESIGLGWFHVVSAIQLGEAYQRAGRFDDARVLANESVTLSRQRQLRGNEARALRLLAEVDSDPTAGDLSNSESEFALALQIAYELNMRPLASHCHVGLARVYSLIGKRQQAQEHLATAMAMYREMGMIYWLQEAERPSVARSGATPIAKGASSGRGLNARNQRPHPFSGSSLYRQSEQPETRPTAKSRWGHQVNFSDVFGPQILIPPCRDQNP